MTAATPRPPETAAPVGIGAVVGFLVFVELTSGFVQGYYVPVVGDLARSLGITDADITWFLTVQALAAGVSVPILAKLGDIFGHRRMLRVAILCVLVGTLLIALAPSYPLVLIGRVIMGPLAVWLPLEIGLVHNRVQGDGGRKGIGMLVSALTIGVVIGSLAGGGLATVLPLTVALLVPSVIVAGCAVIVFTLVPESTVRTSPKIDAVGFVLLGLFMLSLLVGLRLAQTSGFGSPLVIGLLVLAAVLLVGFVLWELRTPVPALNIRLIASRALGPVYLAAFLFGMVLFGTQTIMTTFLGADPAEQGFGFHFGSGIIGVFTAAIGLLGAIGAATFSFLAKPFGLRVVIMGGLAACAVGYLLYAALPTVLAAIVVGYLLNGLGTGLLLGALPALVSEVAPRDETGIATGVYNSLRTLGGAVAGAIFGVLLAAFLVPNGSGASLGGYVTVWVICAVFFVGGIVAIAFQRFARPDTRMLAADLRGEESA